ncbi:major facilitator superfamily domain-containing protein [Butyriboletus roseoflavus]|nr:major facilitator superfamily domain-containing protein [Butyriboletus roseoflavus]
MPVPADSQSIYSTATAVHTFDQEVDIPVVLDDEPSSDPFLVRFSPGDPENPKNWSPLKRWYLTMTGGLLVLSATFSSSAPSPIIGVLLQEFGFSAEVGTLTISLFVCGYCVGPLLWGPLSEQYGRRPIFILSFFGFMVCHVLIVAYLPLKPLHHLQCFQIGSALSKNTASILVFRFLGGTFAAAPLANSGALISDIWGPKERGAALAVFTVAPFAGPSIGPIVGGYLYQAGVSWRWVFWILATFVSQLRVSPIRFSMRFQAGVCWLQIILTVPETFEPILLVKMARERRKNTGDERYYAAMETNSMKFADRIEAILARPFKILFQEPILFVLTIYMSFVYGCIYMLFEAYPIVYTEGHGLKPGPAGLVYLPLPIGGFLAVVVYLLFVNTDYARKVEEFAPEPVPPEYRLRVAMIASPLLTASFFWFAWTSSPSISIWLPLASALVLGFSICWIFVGFSYPCPLSPFDVTTQLALINYIIDVYLFVSASALAATVVVRSAFGTGFPMYTKLGPEWASSLVGFVALVLTPAPFILSKYGPAIRSRSKFVPPRPSSKMSA